MLDLQRMEMFVAVMDARSFTGAAHNLGLTKAVVSFNIKQLEQMLGVSLLTRSTRQISPTDAGEIFYLRCLKLLRDAEEILNEVRSDHRSLSGLLRVTATPEYGAEIVVPALSAFAAQHPQLRIQHNSSSKNNDLISKGFDVGIRLGRLEDSTYHAKLIDRFDVIPVTSKEFIKIYCDSPITDIKQLQGLRWIAHSRLSKPLDWQVVTPSGEEVSFSANVLPAITTDSAASLLAFVRSNAGIALLPRWLVQDDIDTGRLIHLLPDYRFPRQGIYAVYPNTRYVSKKVRMFIDFLQDYIRHISKY